MNEIGDCNKRIIDTVMNNNCKTSWTFSLSSCIYRSSTTDTLKQQGYKVEIETIIDECDYDLCDDDNVCEETIHFELLHVNKISQNIGI